jgi:hypothetical protein
VNVKFVGLNINVRIDEKMSVRIYPMATLCRTHNFECVTVSYVRNYLSGNFEMREGGSILLVSCNMCDEHSVAVQHWAAV